MRFEIPRVLLAALVFLFAIELFPPFTPRTFAADGPCTSRDDNLTRNGSFGGGYDTQFGVVGESWNAFIFGGDPPHYDLTDNENAVGDFVAPYSQFIVGEGHEYDAGIFQVVSGIQPGASYDFKVGMAQTQRDLGGGNLIAMNDVGRRVGVDPLGGTDPHSPNVIWGPEYWTGGAGYNKPEMLLTFKAQSQQVTVYARVFNRNPAAADKIWFDVICVLPRGDIPVEAVQPSVTPTSPATAVPPTSADPPTPRPTRVPPTATRVPATDVPTVPAQAFTATPPKVAQRRATPTPEPRSFIPQGGNTNNSSNDASGGGNGLSLAVILGSVGIIGISLLGIVLIGGFAIWRIFMRQVDDALDPTYSPDDQSPYQ